jgi:hypothetical protein
MRGSVVATQRRGRRGGIVVPARHRLVAVPDEIDGQVVDRSFFSDVEADAAFEPDSTEDALSLAGAWSHLDWEETVEALDRIRHESKPTPPIEDL